jgi:RNA-binding protein Musashi
MGMGAGGGGGFDPNAMAMMYQNMMKGQGGGMGGGMGMGFDPSAMAMMYQNMMKSESMMCLFGQGSEKAYGRHGGNERTSNQPKYGHAKWWNGNDGQYGWNGNGRYGYGRYGKHGNDG